jgi:hypothetical protein
MSAVNQKPKHHQVSIEARCVVQAHVSSGALQARMNLWNVKLTAGLYPSGEAIQRKGRNGVEAFRVPLRPKAGGLPLPSDVRTKMETALVRTSQTFASTSDMKRRHSAQSLTHGAQTFTSLPVNTIHTHFRDKSYSVTNSGTCCNKNKGVSETHSAAVSPSFRITHSKQKLIAWGSKRQ